MPSAAQSLLLLSALLSLCSSCSTHYTSFTHEDKLASFGEAENETYFKVEHGLPELKNTDWSHIGIAMYLLLHIGMVIDPKEPIDYERVHEQFSMKLNLNYEDQGITYTISIPDSFEKTISGSAAITPDGYFITAAHCISSNFEFSHARDT